MSDMNKVFILGRLGQDPELRYTQTQKPVTSLSVATTKKWGENEKTIWHSVTVWGKQAELCSQFLQKGAQVLVEGMLDFQSWEKDGERRTKTIIQADNVTFLSRPPQGQGNPVQQQTLDDAPF